MPRCFLLVSRSKWCPTLISHSRIDYVLRLITGVWSDIDHALHLQKVTEFWISTSDFLSAKARSRWRSRCSSNSAKASPLLQDHPTTLGPDASLLEHSNPRVVGQVYLKVILVLVCFLFSHSMLRAEAVARIMFVSCYSLQNFRGHHCACASAAVTLFMNT